ncbi:hypothetical protein DSO57_1018482 [Entomophthora muscae]|uniref:Uncharacterized protein n=1 Tax=Entomophthora muscae TaxID=34485 RepID=A0ACC2RVI9_9FUNG|nr:hypothetical protein DSO57_1018482 [Entomophthora muscae]
MPGLAACLRMPAASQPAWARLPPTSQLLPASPHTPACSCPPPSQPAPTRHCQPVPHPARQMGKLLKGET